MLRPRAFQHLTKILYLDGGGPARCSTPWDFSLEVGPRIVTVLSPCCFAWLKWDYVELSWACDRCKLECAVTGELGRGGADEEELQEWLEVLLRPHFDPLGTFLTATELAEELLRVRASLSR